MEPPQRYFAIRTCHSLQAPAIFCCWEDCSAYVDADDDDDINEARDPEFQVFDHLQNAVDYIDFYLFELQQDLKQKHQMHTNDNETTNTKTSNNHIAHAAGIGVAGLRQPQLQPTPLITYDNNYGAAAITIPPPCSRKRAAEAAFLGDFLASPGGGEHHRNQIRRKLPLAATATAIGKSASPSTANPASPSPSIPTRTPIKPNAATRDNNIALGVTDLVTQTSRQRGKQIMRPTEQQRHLQRQFQTTEKVVDHRANENRKRHSTTKHQDVQEEDHQDEEEEEEEAAAAAANDFNIDDEVDDEDNRQFDHMFQVYKDTVAAKKAIKTNRKLQAWVNHQRKEYEAFRDKSPDTTMTVDRLTRLTEAGFPFQKKHTFSWDERAAQWLEYRAEHGKDPSTDNLGLYKWTYLQRSKYERHQVGQKTNLTDEQIRKLTEWGFCWSLKFKAGADKAEAKCWEDRLQELIEFKNIHGHTSPPERLPGLGPWVQSQRLHYRKFLKGEKCKMTSERLAKLLQTGFDFTSCGEKNRIKREQRKLLEANKPKRKPGRPKKPRPEGEKDPNQPKRKRGRPKKLRPEGEQDPNQRKRKRARSQNIRQVEDEQDHHEGETTT